MRVAVVGGGLAGLAAAEALVSRGAEVTVFEARSRFGGQVHTERANGFVIEHGAEGFPARRSATRELCARHGLADRIISQRTSRALVLRDGSLAPLPQGEAVRLLGMQVDPADLGAGLVTLLDGLGELIAALVHRLSASATLQSGCAVQYVDREDAGWTLHGRAMPRFRADAVVLALPARSCASLLARAAGPVPALASVPHASSVTVSVAFRRPDVGHLLDASGFVVADPDEGGLRACVFCSSKFPNRAPPGVELVRAFFRPEPEELQKPDAHWIRRATEALEGPLSLSASPLQGWVARWPGGLPQYPSGHTEAIQTFRERLALVGGLVLAGSAVDQGGVDGAVRSGQAAADRLLTAPAFR